MNAQLLVNQVESLFSLPEVAYNYHLMKYKAVLMMPLCSRLIFCWLLIQKRLVFFNC